MHAPFALRAKAEKAEKVLSTWIRPRSWLVAIVIAGVALAAYFERGTLYDWFAGPQMAATIPVSGNIEAHQSVLGFKTVQSRIVELPFDEGQWVDKGTLIARLDDSDYRQQVAINQAALDMQQRQLAAAEQDLTATGQTVQSDAADLTFRQQEYDRAAMLLKQGSGTVEQRDQTYAALRQSTAAHERDVALKNAAERQVELAKAVIESAAATLKMSQIVLGYTVLTAPFSGVIQVRQAEVGEIMVPGTPVVTSPISITFGCAPTSTRPISAGCATARRRTSPPRPIREKPTRGASLSSRPMQNSRRKAWRPTLSASRSSIASASTSITPRTNLFRACPRTRC